MNPVAERMRYFALVLLCNLMPMSAAEIEVSNPAGLKVALLDLKDGDVIKIAPGIYPPGNTVSGISNLTIEAADPGNKPVFEGGKEAWHFTRTPGLKFRNLIVRSQSGNGINLDDGGEMDVPVEKILIEDIEVADIGPKGNFDGIKCSGLKDLVIRNCSVIGWGGQAIDFVGCRDSLITQCVFEGKKGFSQNTGPQFKGGCENIVIEKCRFLNAGDRPIQAGGSTGSEYFRPPGVNYEARNITIRNNVIEGGMCATAFTGVNGAEFTGNKVIRPDKWIFRVLQETRDDGFQPCGDVKIIDNEFVFRREDIRIEMNIGEGTAPGSFTFERNRWFAEDEPKLSKPTLPTEERDGKYE